MARPRIEPLEARALPSGNAVWTILGDRQPGNPDDVIVVERDAEDPGVLRAVVNGEVVSRRPAAGLSEICVYAGDGDDAVTVRVGNRDSAFVARVWGGAGDDRLTGTHGADDLRGGRGDDTVDGADGDDTISAGAGDDRVRSGRGADRLDGGGGSNTFLGNGRRDVVVRAGDGAAFRRENANPLNRVESADELRDWVADRAVAGWQSWLGRAAEPLWTAAPRPAGGAAGGPTTTSTDTGTNTQEDGVDEADTFKTDGRYLYTVAGNELLVVDAAAPDRLALVGRVALGGDAFASAFYLMGDRAVVLSHGYEYEAPDDAAFPPPVGVADAPLAASRLWWGYSRPVTVVTTVDVSDRTAPRVVHETTLDGWLADSRAVGGRVYAVVGNDLAAPRPLLLNATGGPVYEGEADYRARLDESLPEVLPGYTTTDFEPGGAVAGGGSLVDGADVYLPETAGGGQLLSIAVFDPAADAPGPASVTTVAGATGEVYASRESLYVAATDYLSPWRGGVASTQLYKFALDGDSAPLDAVGSVDGTVLNQFSMDEEGGYFRIATTSGWGDDATNAVYVLADAGAELRRVGAVTDIGVTETIHSVRFEGDTGYVVTFRRVDPLFVLDLSDPTRPAVAGELTIPGFSSYLQLVGDGLLIGLGRDADPRTGAVGGLQLSLFDVSDPARPARRDVFTFSAEAWGGSSEAEWDHHALSWFADAGVLALPVAGDWSDPAVLEVLRVGPDGIEELGEVAHDSPVQRSLRVGGVLYSLSAGEIQAHRLTDPSVRLGRVGLPAPPTREPILVPFAVV